MALLLRHGLVYLHIPKTGGNWLRKLLGDHGCVASQIEHKHASYDMVVGRLRHRNFLEKHFTLRHVEGLKYVAVVRNPLAWYESWFKYQTANGFKDWGQAGSVGSWHVMSSINGIKHHDFNEFVMAIHSAQPSFVTTLYAAYVSRSAAILLKNESIRDDFASINSQFSLNVPEETIFKSDAVGVSPQIPILWDQKVLDKTVDLEKAAFSLYGYHWNDVVKVG